MKKENNSKLSKKAQPDKIVKKLLATKIREKAHPDLAQFQNLATKEHSDGT